MSIVCRLIRKPIILKVALNGELIGHNRNGSITRRLLMRIRTILMKWSVGNSFLVALNREAAEEIESLGGKNYVILPNGVDTEVFHPVENDVKASIRKTLRFDMEDVVLLFVGRYVANKGLDTMLDTIQPLINKYGKKIKICFKGSAKLQAADSEDQLFSMIKQYPANVFDLPAEMDVVHCYQMADVYVSPSFKEGMPNSVLEALACGLPCILSNIEPHKDLKDKNQDAYIELFSTGISQALFECINTFIEYKLNDPKRTSSKILSPVFNIENVAAEYVKLYMNLL